MSISCFAKFHRNPAVYDAGEFVKGVIIIRVRQNARKVTDVTFRAKGHTKCDWDFAKMKKIGDEEVLSDKKCSRDGIHFKTHNHSLLSSHPKSDKYYILEPGTHEFDFEFEIPEESPGSIEHRLGYVSYFIEVVIRGKNWMSSDEKFRMPFKVNSRLDLSTNPNSQKPVNICSQNGYSRGGFLIIYIPKSGFSVDETIPINIKIRNLSIANIPIVSVELHKILTFHSKYKKEEKSMDTCEYQKCTIGPKMGEDFSWDADILIPSSCPPSTTLSNMAVDIQYYIKVKASAGKQQNNSKYEIPITVGTIPTHGSQVISLGVDPFKVGPSTSRNVGLIPDRPPAYGDLFPENHQSSSSTNSRHQL